MKAFLVGIKGVGMTNLAIILKKMGWTVSGCDVAEEFITDEPLKKNNISIVEGFKPEFISEFKPEIVIYTAAHKGIDNPVVLQARSKGIKVQHFSEFLGELLKKFKNRVLIAGTHGKTTTTSLTSFLMKKTQRSSAYLVGTSEFSGLLGGDFTGFDNFVLEADEYAVSPPKDKRIKFLLYPADYILIPSIDYDHPDVYTSLEDVLQAFEKLILKNKRAKVFLNFEDKGVRKLYKRLSEEAKKRVFRAGYQPEFEVRIVGRDYEDGYMRVNLKAFKKDISLKTRIFGEKNALNLALVAGFFVEAKGFDSEDFGVLQEFTGLKRRQEFYGKNRSGKLIFDDYAHHPTEIEAIYKAFKEAFPKKRFLFIFQPHTFSRTQALLNEFKKVFKKLDFLILLPIFASARENSSDFSLSEKDILSDLPSERFFYASDKRAALDLIKQLEAKIDIIVTVGAGDVYKLISEIKKL